MNAECGRWRRWAVKLVQHAASVLPGAQSPWADAMRRELDYIGDDPAALRWALGCVVASYRVRLLHRPRCSAVVAVRQIAAGAALMLLIGVAIQDRAGGQTEPPRPVVDGRACDLPGAPTETRSNSANRVRRSEHNRAADAADCSDPLFSKTPDTPSGR